MAWHAQQQRGAGLVRPTAERPVARWQLELLIVPLHLAAAGDGSLRAAAMARRHIVELAAQAPAVPTLATALWEAAPWPRRGAPRGALPGPPEPRVVTVLGALARASTDPATREGASRALLTLLRQQPPLQGLAAALRAAARASCDAGLRGELFEALRAANNTA